MYTANDIYNIIKNEILTGRYIAGGYKWYKINKDALFFRYTLNNISFDTDENEIDLGIKDGGDPIYNSLFTIDMDDNLKIIKNEKHTFLIDIYPYNYYEIYKLDIDKQDINKLEMIITL